MRYALALIVVLLVATGCVSSRLAEANERAVHALASAAVTVDETSKPLADESLDVAAKIVDATGTFAQVTSLGVPAALTDANMENVSALSRIVAPDASPEVAAVVERAQGSAAELAGKARTQATFATAAKTTPIGTTITEILGILGGVGASAYGATRGRKHLTRWWNEPPKGPAPADAPNADAAA